MDAGRRECKKGLIIGYIFTLSLLATFFYHLLWTNRKSILEVTRLKEDVEKISKALLQNDYAENLYLGKKIKSITDDPGGFKGSSATGACDTREMNAYVDTLVKRKIGTIMDDVYHLKKQVMTSGCNSQGNSMDPQTEAMILSTTRLNFASEELGARINTVLAKPIHDSNFIKTLLGLEFSANPPINMLRPSTLPGSCFGFRGSKATVSIHLAKNIIVEEISLMHVPKEMTPSICVDNAPKDFDIYGLPADSNQKELLGEWTYENSPNQRTQSYIVKNTGVYRDLILTINSNHGANSTCIYRMEVYGRMP